MVNVSILNEFGHEYFEDLTVEEAKRLIDETIDAEGTRYFIVDKDTKQILREIKLQEDQDIALIPIVVGG